MRLFHAPTSRSDRILWLCDEMGVSIDIVPVVLRQAPAEMLALNPSGTVPVLELDDGSVIIESVAALLYLAGRFSPDDLGVDPSSLHYPDYLNFCVFAEAGLAAPMKGLIMTHFRAPDQIDNYTAKATVEAVVARLKVLEKRLAGGREFLVADRFTVADICITRATDIILPFVPTLSPEVIAYRQRMIDRPAYQRVRGSAAAAGRSPT
jgi:glutathione S-transferase